MHQCVFTEYRLAVILDVFECNISDTEMVCTCAMQQSGRVGVFACYFSGIQYNALIFKVSKGYT